MTMDTKFIAEARDVVGRDVLASKRYFNREMSGTRSVGVGTLVSIDELSVELGSSHPITKYI